MLEVRDRLNFEDYLDSLLNSVESDDLGLKVLPVDFLVAFGIPIQPSPMGLKEELSCLGYRKKR